MTSDNHAEPEWRIAPTPAGIRVSEGILLTGCIERLQAPLYAAEAVSIRKAVEKRCREFRAGRTLARQALMQLGVGGKCELPAREHRAPRWPERFTGSIAHSDRYCACAVARLGDIRAVGIDIEQCGRIRKELWPRLFTTDEIGVLQAHEDHSRRAFLATVFFCAKEAFYKLQYELTEAWLDFTDASVTLDSPGQVTITPAPEALIAGHLSSVTGHYTCAWPDTVLCQCWFSLNGKSACKPPV